MRAPERYTGPSGERTSRPHGAVLGRESSTQRGGMEVITAELERWFGPNGQYFGPKATPPTPEQLQRPKLAAEVSKATFQEFRLPNPRSMPHSLTVDANGQVWLAGWDSATNAVLRFDPAARSSTITGADGDAVPHTPCPRERSCLDGVKRPRRPKIARSIQNRQAQRNHWSRDASAANDRTATQPCSRRG